MINENLERRGMILRAVAVVLVFAIVFGIIPVSRANTAALLEREENNPSPSAQGSGSQKLDVYYSLAVGYISREEYDKAITYLDKALELVTEESDPSLYTDLRLKKGCVYTIQQAYEDAIRELDEASRVQPELAEPYLVRVQVYTEQGEVAKAAADLERYVELTGDSGMIETLAQMYLQIDERDKAIDSYRKLAENTSEDETLVLYNLAVYEMGAGMYEEALANLQTCEPDAAKLSGLYYSTGVCYMMLNQYPEAMEAFTTSIDAEDHYSDAVYNRAICGVLAQDFEAAAADFTAYIEHFEIAAEASENDQVEAEGEKPEGDTTKPEGEKPEADTAEPAEEADAVAYYYRGICYLSIAQYAEAAADFTVCLEREVNVNESTLNRGLSYLQGGEFEAARADFTACIDAGYSVDDALYYRSIASHGLNDDQAALEDLNICIEHGYELGQTYQQRAQVYHALGDEDRYLEDLEAALEYLDN